MSKTNLIHLAFVAACVAGAVGCGAGVGTQSVKIDTTDGKVDDADKKGLHVDLNVEGVGMSGMVDPTTNAPLPVDLEGVTDVKLSYNFSADASVSLDEILTSNGGTITLVSGNWAIKRDGQDPITLGAVWQAYSSGNPGSVDINGIDPSKSLILNANIPLGQNWDVMPQFIVNTDGSKTYEATFTWHIK